MTPLTPKQLAKERRASLKRQAKRERERERELSSRAKPRKKVRFGGTVRVGKAQRGDR